jgi:uncharacterized protein YyaL (SSP411 family)
MPNRLGHEASPYLLQHANNPVDWFPWGEEAFEKARAEDKPIFLSIGYSTCHWCHVMEHESFENEQIAGLLNQHYVPVKVDREERPDVDRIYMMFVQATTGSGGWPMSVFLTPDLKPFYGGTYFPPENRYGRPGFASILDHLASAWAGDRQKILDSGEAVLSELRKYSVVRSASDASLDPAVLSDSLYQQLRRSFDAKLGGFGTQPKFPRPVVYNFLLRHYHLTKNDEALEMVTKTLDEMARGGMNDQLGGGFHRYSVDAQWFVPHFEKMLYDQAQLAISYLEAYQITGTERYASNARSIFDYVLRDMTDEAGGFFSAEDADSVDPAKPGHKSEGAFYIWTYDDIAKVIGEDVMPWFAYRYGCAPAGNVHEDPQQEFVHRNILYESRSLTETSQRFGVAEAELSSVLEEAARKLLAARGTRVRPGLDDKVLTAWNGLMISTFARGFVVLDEPRYLAAAQKAAAFIRSELLSDGVLLRRYRQGSSAIPGFLDDYAYFTQALLDLHQADFDPRHLDLARQMAEDLIDLFEDEEHGGFFSTTGADADLIMRIKDDYDGAEPSGNSAAACALVSLHAVTGEVRYLEAAERLFKAFAPRLTQGGQTLPQLLVALLAARTPHRQVVFAGPYDAGFVRQARARFAPFQSVLRGEWSPTPMPAVDGKATAYVCQNFTCQLPVTDAESLAGLLGGSS